MMKQHLAQHLVLSRDNFNCRIERVTESLRRVRTSCWLQARVPKHGTGVRTVCHGCLSCTRDEYQIIGCLVTMRYRHGVYRHWPSNPVQVSIPLHNVDHSSSQTTRCSGIQSLMMTQISQMCRSSLIHAKNCKYSALYGLKRSSRWRDANVVGFSIYRSVVTRC